MVRDVGHVTFGVVSFFAGQTIATRTGYYAADVTTIIGDHHNTGNVQIPNVAGPGSRVHRYTDPYGKPRGPHTGQGADGGADGNWTGEHGYLDKPIDSTGLTAIGARMYDPVLGAFISVDPIMDLVDPQQWNAYVYSNSNPTTWSDPTGMLVIRDPLLPPGGVVERDGPPIRDDNEVDRPVAQPDLRLPEEFDRSDEVQTILEEAWAAGDEILDDFKERYGPAVQSYWDQYRSAAKYYRQLLGPVGTVMTFEDYCRQNGCVDEGWGGFYRDGAFWLTVNQVANEELISLVGGVSGGAAGTAGGAFFGGLVGTVAIPVIGTVNLGTVGAIGGGALGAGAGSVAGGVVAGEFNANIRRRWQQEGLVD